MTKLSVIIPILNEEQSIAFLLKELAEWCREDDEVILVDGGSRDGGVSIAEKMGFHVVVSERGRGRQMNRGASLAEGAVFWFLHADSRISNIARSELDLIQNNGACWGHFKITIAGAKTVYRLIESFMNLRSRISGIATGDMGILVKAEVFRSIGGFPEIDLMEDIELCKRLRSHKPFVSSKRLLVSERRWEAGGIYKTICLMWVLRLAWFFGVSDQTLSRIYNREK
jgi:rSAM/selenodomain-associated transferase 2